ncbi:hypothetical protein Plhal304r1_c001g0001171 [Plasmopara halstedii]
MLIKSLRRTPPQKQILVRLQNQRRHGGSVSKNKHIENWNNWRGDSEKRFKMDNSFFTSLTVWGLVPFGLYFVLASDERRKRDKRDVSESFRQ